MESNWLTEAGRLVLAGYISPGWLLRSNLLAVVERDKEGHYFISNEELGVYAVGFSHEQALEDFKHTLIDNYGLLEKGVETDLDLIDLFGQYQKCLKRRVE